MGIVGLLEELPPLHDVKLYRVPPLVSGVLTEIICNVPAGKLVDCDELPEYIAPSMVMLPQVWLGLLVNK